MRDTIYIGDWIYIFNHESQSNIGEDGDSIISSIIYLHSAMDSGLI